MDDTGARHAAKNGFCTQIGNDDFAWFGTRTSKSQLRSFLDLLRAGRTTMSSTRRRSTICADVTSPGLSSVSWRPINRRGSPIRLPGSRISISLASAVQVTPDPICIATEGELWGSVQAHGLLREMVILSAMTPASSTLAITRCAGCMRNGWCTSWRPSPICTAPRSSACAHSSGGSMMI